jgi:sugar lactone lactonase YvrE
MTKDVVCVAPTADTLGESVLWCPRSRKVWWVDVMRAVIHELSWPEMVLIEHDLPFRRIGSIGLQAEGGLLVTTEQGAFRWSPEHGLGACVMAPRWDPTVFRLNDGRADRAGRFWVGSMHDSRFVPEGTLYSRSPGGTVNEHVGGIIVPNAIAFSPDNRWFYFADTRRYVIWRYAFDLAEGLLSERQVFVDFGSGPGRPDGSCVDVDGCIWNTCYEGSRLIRYTPAGRIDREIELPVSFPTCVALGGDALDTLFITTASGPLPEARRAAEPLAGHLFAVSVENAGLPEPLVRL